MKLTLAAVVLVATALLAGCNDAGPAKPDASASSTTTQSGSRI